MISITDSTRLSSLAEECLLPTGGRRMEVDWECVGRAFQVANGTVGWNAIAPVPNLLLAWER